MVRFATAAVRRTLLVRIEPAWAIVAVSAVCVLLVVGIARLLVDLAEVWTPRLDGVIDIAIPVRPPSPVGRVVLDEGHPILEIDGEPGMEIVVMADGRTPMIIRLDENGHAVVDALDLQLETREIRLRAIGADDTKVTIPEMATASHIRSPSPTSTATRTATSTATSTRPRTVSEPPPVSPTAPPAETAIPQESGAATATLAGASDDQTPPVLHLVTDAGPRLALTFDGAESANGTADLLDLLQRLDLKVTIFVTGEFIQRHPSVVRGALLAGHELGNHTYSHPHLTSYPKNRRHTLLPNVSKTWFLSELRRTEEAFRAATGRPMAPLWRAPYGEENAILRAWATEMGYLHVRWSSLQGVSLDSLDWVEDEHSSLYFDSSRLVDRLLAFPELEGGIVLMHLSTKRRVPPWSELPRFVGEIRQRRLQVGSVSVLLEHSDLWRPWLERARVRHDKVFPE